MSSVECLREFVNERLTTAAEEIFRVFIKTIVQYEEEIDRQRRLLDICWKPEIKLHRIELPQQHVCKVEVLTDQQLCNQERNFSLYQEDPEPPQIKDEQEELWTSQVEEQLVLKQETETFMSTPTHEESDSSHIAESRDQKRDNHGDSASTRNTEPKPKKSHKLPQPHVCEEEEVFTDQQLCNQERNSSLYQEDSEPPQIKQEQEGLCTSQEGEQLLLKQETDTFILTPTHEESDHSKAEPNSDCQLLSHTFHVPGSQDEKGDNHRDSELTRNTGPKLKKRHNKSRSHSNFTTPKFHSNTHIGKTSLKCDTCGKAFVFQSKLNAHVRSHTGEKPYSCKTCGKRFSHMSTLNVHLRIHTGEKPFTCKTCGRAFRKSSDLSAHMRRAHTDDKPFTCTMCGSTFRLSDDLTVHIRKAHTGEKPYLCKTCGRGFTVMSKLKIHTRIHTGEKPYLCSTCGKTFHDITLLMRHMRVHTGEKPFICKTCGKDFRARPNLLVHMRTHTGEMPYTCKTCGRDFRFRNALSVHMRTHTGEKPYTCKTCGRAFTYSGHLTVHMRTHTGEKPYSCNTCGKKFIDSSPLARHIKSHTSK